MYSGGCAGYPVLTLEPKRCWGPAPATQLSSHTHHTQLPTTSPSPGYTLLFHAPAQPRQISASPALIKAQPKGCPCPQRTKECLGWHDLLCCVPRPLYTCMVASGLLYHMQVLQVQGPVFFFFKETMYCVILTRHTLGNAELWLPEVRGKD